MLFTTYQHTHICGCVGMGKVFFYVLLCRNRQRLLLSYRVRVSLCLTTILENLFLNNKRHNSAQLFLPLQKLKVGQIKLN